MTLRELVSVIARRKGLIVLVIAATLFGAALYTFTIPTMVYEAEAALLVTPQIGGGEPAVEGPSLTEVLRAPVRSVETHRRLLEDPGLLKRACQEAGAPEPVGVGPRPVRVETVPETDVLVLTVAHQSRDLSAQIANKLAELYVEESRERSVRAAETAASELEAQIAEVQSELADKEDAVRDFKMTAGVADLPTELATYTGLLATLAGEEATASADSISSQRMADQYRTLLRRESQTQVTATTVARNPVVAQLEADLTTLELERAGMAATRGLEHPEVKRLDQRIAQAREELSRAVSTVVESEVQGLNPVYADLASSLASAEATARASQARQAALQSLLADQQRRMAAMPKIQTELARLERDAQITAQVYERLSQQCHELRIQEAMVTPSVEVVTEATPPLRPARPNAMVNLAIGLLLGLLFAAMAVGIAESMDDAIRTSWQAQAALGLPSLGVIPKAVTGSPLLAADGYGLEVSDAFRTLRTNLRLSLPEGVPASIVVTSPRPADGRTTVAVNLGVTLAQSGKRVLVLDADLRRPTLHALLGTPASPGFTDALAGAADPLSCVLATRVPNLYALPGGAPASPHADLLESGRVIAVLDALRPSFDVIILDTSSLSASSDALALAPLCDAAIEVVRVGATPMKVANGAAAKLAHAGRCPIGLVFNQVRLQGGR